MVFKLEENNISLLRFMTFNKSPRFVFLNIYTVKIAKIQPYGLSSILTFADENLLYRTCSHRQKMVVKEINDTESNVLFM